jgi:hypothetical protein
MIGFVDFMIYVWKHQLDIFTAFNLFIIITPCPDAHILIPPRHKKYYKTFLIIICFAELLCYNSYPALYPSVILSNLFYRIADCNELQVIVIMTCLTDYPVIQVYKENTCHVTYGKHHLQSEDQANKNIIDAYITSYIYT